MVHEVEIKKPSLNLDDRYGWFDAIWDDNTDKMQQIVRSKPMLVNLPEKVITRQRPC